MTKNNDEHGIKEILQMIDIPLPNIVRSRVDETLAQLPARRTFRKKLVYVSCASVLLIGCIVGSGFISPTMAQTLQKIPFVGSIFEQAGDPGLRAASQDGFASQVNEALKDQDITLEINDVLYDGSRIAISYNYVSEQDLPKDMYKGIKIEKVLVNGKPLGNYGGSGTGEEIGEREYIGVANIYPREPLPDQFELTLSITEIAQSTGNWKFTFPVSRKQADSATYSFTPNIQKNINNTTYSIEQVLFTPSTTEVKFLLRQSKDNPFLDFSSNQFHVEYRLMDDRGMYLQPFGSSSSGSYFDEYVKYELSAQFAPTKAKPEYLILQPYRTYIKNGVEPEFFAVDVTGTFPLDLSQGGIGEIRVTNIQFLEDQTVVTYEVFGDDPFMQANSLWFEDQQGNRIHSLHLPQRMDEESYTFQLEFPAIDFSQQLKLVTVKRDDLDMIEEMEVKIPLKWQE